jgi:hypothetical protein
MALVFMAQMRILPRRAESGARPLSGAPAMFDPEKERLKDLRQRVEALRRHL